MQYVKARVECSTLKWGKSTLGVHRVLYIFCLQNTKYCRTYSTLFKSPKLNKALKN